MSGLVLILACLATVSSVLSTGLFPSTNIFTPPWLNQRRARHLVQPHQYILPQYQQQAYASPHYSSSRAVPAYYVQPYSPVIAPVQLPFYQTAPVYAHYVSPFSGHSSFAKRVDTPTVAATVDKQAEDGSHESTLKTSTTPCQLQSGQSQNYPVYVLPPKNFQPIVYHAQPSPLTSYLSSVPLVYHQSQGENKIKSAEELWYDTESGSAQETKVKDNEIESGRLRKKIVYVPVLDNAFNQFPVYEAVIQDVKDPVEGTKAEKTTTVPNKAQDGGNWYSTKPTRTRRYKTKLPVGMTSFFLGGIRGVSGRHWNLPADLVKHLEFMPNTSPMSPENKYLPEESYVKQVDNDQTVVASSGEPEKEDNQDSQAGTKAVAKKPNFEHNTIIDSALDLEAQESTNQANQAKQPEADRRDQGIKA